MFSYSFNKIYFEIMVLKQLSIFNNVFFIFIFKSVYFFLYGIITDIFSANNIHGTSMMFGRKFVYKLPHKQTKNIKLESTFGFLTRLRLFKNI